MVKGAKVGAALLLLAASSSGTVGSTVHLPPVPAQDQAALREIVDQLCRKEIALLGEPSSHGAGHANAFRVALVQQLVSKCHFNAIFFEGSYYEFEAIARARRQGQTVTPAMVSAAVGGLWKFGREFQPLLPFLAAEATGGRLALGGIDFQMGGFEQPYTNDLLPVELTNFLAGDRRAVCREAFRQRAYRGYAVSRRPDLRQCVEDISQAMQSRTVVDARLHAEQGGMLESLGHYFASDPTDSVGYVNARDREMFVIFQRLKARLPKRSRIIVWTATAHAAKDATAFPPFASVKNLGSYLHEAYGSRAFSIGITAFSGSYRYGNRHRSQPPAPPDSLEAQAMGGAGSDTVYLGPSRLRRIGVVPSAVFDHVYLSENWAKAVDGMVVFHTEYPPQDSRPGF